MAVSHYPEKLTRLLTRKAANDFSDIESVILGGELKDYPVLNDLIVDRARSIYGPDGVKRFYRSLLEVNQDVDDSPPKRSILGYLTGAKVYDLIYDKTGSHALSLIGMAVTLEETVSVASSAVFSLLSYVLDYQSCAQYISEGGTCQMPTYAYYLSLLQYYLTTPVPSFLGMNVLEFPAVVGLCAASAAIGGIIGAGRLLLRKPSVYLDETKNGLRMKTGPVHIKEIKEDIRSYLNDFYTVWAKYANHLLRSDPYSDVHLDQLNAMYMLTTSNISRNLEPRKKRFTLTEMKYGIDKLCSGIKNDASTALGRKGKESVVALASILKAPFSALENLIKSASKNIIEHDRQILPSIYTALGKKATVRNIIHRCPESVGGATAIPQAFFNKILPIKRIIGPVFVNTERVRAAPSYDFSVAHELTHDSGEGASEPVANYFALKALDDLAGRFPFNGYDLYTATARLCFAVGALADKIGFEKMYEKLPKISVDINGHAIGIPSFVYDGLDGDFEPESSPLPPMDIKTKGRVERLFRQLYVAGSYYAIKKMRSREIMREYKRSQKR